MVMGVQPALPTQGPVGGLNWALTDNWELLCSVPEAAQVSRARIVLCKVKSPLEILFSHQQDVIQLICGGIP